MTKINFQIKALVSGSKSEQEQETGVCMCCAVTKIYPSVPREIS